MANKWISFLSWHFVGTASPVTAELSVTSNIRIGVRIVQTSEPHTQMLSMQITPLLFGSIFLNMSVR